MRPKPDTRKKCFECGTDKKKLVFLYGTYLCTTCAIRLKRAGVNQYK